MAISSGLLESMNAIRETMVEGNQLYHKLIPEITADTDISQFAQPIINTPVVMNDFVNTLVNKLVFTQFETKFYNNPLKELEGDNLPLGYAGESIYVDPQPGIQFNVEDYAMILQKYEAKVKVQYLTLNSDLQYPVTVSREQLKTAMTSWSNLESFIGQLSGSLYNGCYIGEYMKTKGLVSSAYADNGIHVDQITAESTPEGAKQFIAKARTYFLNFQAPSCKYNGWGLKGDGEKITTFTRPEDIVFLIRNDILAYIDVNVLASAFNLDKATLAGKIIPVDNFDVTDPNTGDKIFDGSKIVGMMADKAWFKIRTQEMYMDDFKNPGNRTWQYILNVRKMYEYSLFANAVCFAYEQVPVKAEKLTFAEGEAVQVVKGKKVTLHIVPDPLNSNNAIQYQSATTANATVAASASDDRVVTVTGVKAGTSVITATAGSVSTTLTVTVVDHK